MFRSDHAMWLAIRIRSARRKRTVVRFASDSPVEGSVTSEPVSEPEFPASWENTGKWLSQTAICTASL